MISALRDYYLYVVADKDFFQINFKGPVRNIWMESVDIKDKNKWRQRFD